MPRSFRTTTVAHPTRFFLIFICALLFTPPLLSQSPEDWLGRPPGTDFQLADWQQIGSWFDRLGDSQATVDTQIVGKSTEGRDFRIAIISSEENLLRIDEIKEAAARIADPRGLQEDDIPSVLAKGRPILFVACNMHSTEIAAAEMSMTLAWRLATSEEEPWATAREQVVTVIIPTVNPDGLDKVVSWYRKIVDTPYESASLPELYQVYAGHDNNRDWFALSLEETKIVTRLLYTEWFPTVYWDVHQQGATRERLFVPPFRDPLNPNLHPVTITGIGVLGSRALLDLTADGFTGISSGVSYDMWWSGGNRNVPVRHNIIGLLSEAASANLASPVWLAPGRLSAPGDIQTGYAPSNRFPAPWPGGWWRVGDIHRYEIALAESLLSSLSREPKRWLKNALVVSKDVVRRGAEEAPRTWLLPPDQRDRDATERLLEILLAEGIEVHQAQTAFVADGRDWPEKTLVLHREQPYGAFLKDLFEVQRYPDGPSPYDVAGWTLPLLFGVKRVEILEKVTVETTPVSDPITTATSLVRAPPLLQQDDVILDSGDSSSIKAIFEAYARGESASMFRDGSGWLLGDEGAQEKYPKNTPLPMPRIGVYAPWSASMDEGWLRWVLDRYDIPYSRLRNEHIRAGDLASVVDVMIIPDVSGRTIRNGRPRGSVFPELAGGLEPEGVIAIEEFVRQGGRLICTGRSSMFAIDLFGIPLENRASGSGDDAFQCPGSVVRTVPRLSGPLAAGLPPSVPVFFSRGLAFAKKESKENLPEATYRIGEPKFILRYPGQGLLLSGWCKNPEVIAGCGAWVRTGVGRGEVDLFGFRPHYRSWSHGNFNLLFRAILLGD